jgi:hypothetical protein
MQQNHLLEIDGQPAFDHGIYVTELFRTERLFFYMIHARRVYESVETEWSAFKSTGSS